MHDGHRTEELLARGARVLGHLGEHRRGIVEASLFGDDAADERLGALLDRRRHLRVEQIALGARDERSELGRGVHRVAEPHGTHGRRVLLDELIGALAHDDEALCRDAGLTVVLDARRDRRRAR